MTEQQQSLSRMNLAEASWQHLDSSQSGVNFIVENVSQIILTSCGRVQRRNGNNISHEANDHWTNNVPVAFLFLFSCQMVLLRDQSSVHTLSEWNPLMIIAITQRT